MYVDFPLLKSIAETCGLHGELVAEGVGAECYVLIL